MKIIFLYRYLLLGFCTSLITFNSFGQSAYITKYKSLADSLSRASGIPFGVIMGIAIVESSSGTSRNCKLLKNHFGMAGKNNVLQTHGIKTRYKQYTSDNASFIDFVKMISRRKYYLKLKGNKNAFDWIDEISKHGYSEVPDVWRNRIKDVIKKNKLQ